MFVHIAPPAVPTVAAGGFLCPSTERGSAILPVGIFGRRKIRIDGSGIPLYNNKKRRF